MITMKNWVLSAPAADQEIGFEGESLIYTLTVQVDAGPDWVYRIELAYSNGRKDILLPEYVDGKLSTVLRWSTLCAPGTVAMQIRATQGNKVRLSTVTTLYIKDSVRAVPVFHSGLPTEFEQLEQDLYAARDAAQSAAEQVLDSIGGAAESASKAASDASRAESARAGAELAAEGVTAAKEAAEAARDAIVGMTVEAETLETGKPATAAGSLEGGVYKLAAVEEADGTITPKIKISENTVKITNPHFKKLYRLYGNDTGKAIADYLCVYDEVVDDSKPLTIFDPEAVWKTKTITNFTARELQVPIFKNGELVYKMPSLDEIRTYCLEQVDTLWDEVKRFDNPHNYYVDLSQKLYDIKLDLLKRNS